MCGQNTSICELFDEEEVEKAFNVDLDMIY